MIRMAVPFAYNMLCNNEYVINHHLDKLWTRQLINVEISTMERTLQNHVPRVQVLVPLPFKKTLKTLRFSGFKVFLFVRCFTVIVKTSDVDTLFYPLFLDNFGQLLDNILNALCLLYYFICSFISLDIEAELSVLFL